MLKHYEKHTHLYRNSPHIRHPGVRHERSRLDDLDCRGHNHRGRYCVCGCVCAGTAGWSGVSERFLSRSEFAARIGVESATLSRYKLPEPDVIVGSGSRPTFGWRSETIDAWNRARPGRGNWKDSRETER